jgi:hypothetical protein
MESERRVGIALSELSTQEREGLIIATKVCDEMPPWTDNGGHDAFSAAGVRASLESSLRKVRSNSRVANAGRGCCVAVAPTTRAHARTRTHLPARPPTHPLADRLTVGWVAGSGYT